MGPSRISLEQWRALTAVVDAGGYAQAAEVLHKSQSAVTYAIQKMETALDVKLFVAQGRRAVLTPTGELLVRRARVLLDEAAALERAAVRLAEGWEAELKLAVEVIFPHAPLFAALARFGEESPQTRIELEETVLGGTVEALREGRVDLVVGPHVPEGWLGQLLLKLEVVPVAHPSHPLHALGRALSLDDLRAHRQLVTRDSGSERDGDRLALEGGQRWTVSQLRTAIAAVADGHGYGWFPEHTVAQELADGRLGRLTMAEGGGEHVALYLMFADRMAAGPGALRLAACLRDAVSTLCAARAGR